ncbi:class II aldolase/adducin family protein [Biomaibacter acetigenes]|uniref:Class II aldolase/adducin family protein n=1 Tax=Biomaibacter acetigenes TaxID=2316383 RepID=A0A3G2R3P6_9FIRM|nr:class II aldolase/adducin family protein [Biomaibacter acetigenes]AYO30080.1 class II aldolase/adducin family protein [Biomaibacter acetigenes]
MTKFEIKQEVVKIAKKADEMELCRHKSGNFSMIDRKEGLIYITPSGISREDLTPEKIIVVDLDGNIVEGTLHPSIETSMHITAYKIKPEARGVAHTHSRYSTIFACMGKEILPVSAEAILYGGKPVKVAEFAPPGSKELARTIIEPMKDSDVCLLKYHGVIAVGEDLEKALIKLIYVEEVAFLYYHMLTLGQKEFMPLEIFNAMLNG